MNRTVISLAACLALFALAGCDDSAEATESTAVCVDQQGNRVADSQCSHDYDHNDGMSAFEWYFIMSTLNQPAYGTQVVHNTYYSSPKSNPYAGFKRPQSAPIAKGVPATGWKPSSGTKAFVPKDKTNLTAPKVPPAMNQKQAPPKPYNNPAPRPVIRVRSK